MAQLGRALRSGLNHRSRRRIFEKSRKPPQTLTFSALPNVEKSSIPRSDHMFDHLQKNLIILPFRGVAKVVSRIVRDDEIAGSSPVTSTKKQPKISHFWLIFGCFSICFSQNRLFSVDHMFALISNLWTVVSSHFFLCFEKPLFFVFCDANFEGWRLLSVSLLHLYSHR